MSWAPECRVGHESVPEWVRQEASHDLAGNSSADEQRQQAGNALAEELGQRAGNGSADEQRQQAGRY